jgi:phenylalanyl-tRNA synthetase alpha chain
MSREATLRASFGEELGAAGSTAAIEDLRIKYLGKKGLVTGGLKELGSLPPDERKAAGQALNELKDEIAEALAERKAVLKETETRQRLDAESIDITLPGRRVPFGSLHPLNRTLDEIVRIFTGMGFGVAEGPEVETDYYNFEALNMPRNHPARDMQDTFYITEDVVLRTHTSPVQIRVMQSSKPPIKIIAPGKVYRCDADVTHSPMFHQVEGLMIGSDISFANLKGVLESFIHTYFGPDVPVRFRPGFFPFTEPSAEIDMGCIFCGEGGGCRVCKDSRWIEILGAGMVHPKVLEMSGIDPEAYTGFAFGMGVERIAMLKYGIDDIRLLFENDLRFLAQF